MKKIDIDSYKSITMEEFLENYVNLDNVITREIVEKLAKSKATHNDLTELGIPYIKRIPFEEVSQDDILTGDVILVNDFKGSNRHPRVAPYIRPSLLKIASENKILRKEIYN